MYIVSILVEHPAYALDATYDYVSKEEVIIGVRVQVQFGKQKLIGYVMACKNTYDSKEKIDQEAGFTHRYILRVLDQHPLLNAELQELSKFLSNCTLSPQIACLQAMLPSQLKPSKTKGASIKHVKRIRIVDATIRCKTKRQQEALSYIIKHPNCSISELPYSLGLVNKLVEQKAIVMESVEVFRDPYQKKTKATMHTLTSAQQRVVDGVLKDFGTNTVSLLHGVTGAGKTEVYLHIAKKVTERNKTVIILVPEISLTPMMVTVFKEQFDAQVAILHSRLSSGERYDEYRRIQQGKASIVVGARSAIFAPLQNIGMILMDEEHDSSYKQENAPKYHTLQVAKWRAKYHRCPILLGSATPSLETYSRALKGIYLHYSLPDRINQKPLPKITLVNMVEEMKRNNYSLLSKEMEIAIRNTLQQGKQVMLLLNKRGYASYVRCKDCGEVIHCPHCDVSMTYHKQGGSLQCHYCEHTTPYPTHCPTCYSSNIRHIGSGTQKMEEVLENLFEGAKVIRYDVDSTRKKGSHEKLLALYEKQEANILLGTQMIAKGLHFPNVTFVGVLNADISLHVPDFRANERTFQLLCQVSGRSGRGEDTGAVMIQTYNPEHYVYQCVKSHDYTKFFYQELEYRRLAKYPPFVHLVSIIIEGKEEHKVSNIAQDIHSYLCKQVPDITILGPANSSIYRMKENYRKRILLKFRDSTSIYPCLLEMQDFYNKGKKSNDALVTCDFNPYSQL